MEICHITEMHTWFLPVKKGLTLLTTVKPSVSLQQPKIVALAQLVAIGVRTNCLPKQLKTGHIGSL